MKLFRIVYSGVNKQLRLMLHNNPQQVQAYTAREAVEQYYSFFHSDNYFPDDDGVIRDSYGDLICAKNDNEIYYYGGFIRAIEVKQ